MNNSKLKIDEFFDKYIIDIEHSQEVAKYCQMISNALTTANICSFDDRELSYLQTAALLHDIGYNVEKKAHHKHSLDIILKEGIEGYTDEEILIIGNIARYHRNSFPDVHSHKMFAMLDEKKQSLVSELSAILRLADGLDKPHKNLILRLRAESEKSLKFYIKTIGYKPSLKAAENKKDLLEKVLNKQISFIFE